MANDVNSVSLNSYEFIKFLKDNRAKILERSAGTSESTLASVLKYFGAGAVGAGGAIAKFGTPTIIGAIPAWKIGGATAAVGGVLMGAGKAREVSYDMLDKDAVTAAIDLANEQYKAMNSPYRIPDSEKAKVDSFISVFAQTNNEWIADSFTTGLSPEDVNITFARLEYEKKQKDETKPGSTGVTVDIKTK